MKNEIIPKISVVIPAYNAELTIIETIESVQNQTFNNLEIIVIDDGSTDKTLELINTINDNRLQVYSYPNGGVAKARNRGMTHAKGDYIAFLDADDLWMEEKLELQLQALEKNPEAGFAYSWAYYMDEGSNLIQPSEETYIEGNVEASLLVYDFIISGSNCLVRKQAIEEVGEFDLEFPCADDWDYWIRLAKNWKCLLIPKHLFFYRISPNSISSKVEFMEKCNLKVVDKGFQAAPAEIQYLKNRSISNIYRYSAHLYLSRIKTGDAAKKAMNKLWKAISLYPQVLGDSWARNLLIKAILMQLFPTNLIIDVIKKIKEYSYNHKLIKN